MIFKQKSLLLGLFWSQDLVPGTDVMGGANWTFCSLLSPLANAVANVEIAEILFLWK